MTTHLITDRSWVEVLSGFRCRFVRVTDEGSLPEIGEFGSYIRPLNVFTAPKRSFLYSYVLFLLWHVLFIVSMSASAMLIHYYVFSSIHITCSPFSRSVLILQN